MGGVMPDPETIKKTSNRFENFSTDLIQVSNKFSSPK